MAITLEDFGEVIRAIARRVDKISPWRTDDNLVSRCIFCDMERDERNFLMSHLDTCEVIVIRRFLAKIDAEEMTQ